MKFGSIRILLLLTLLLAGVLAWMWFDEHGQLRNATWVAPAPLPPDVGGAANTRSQANSEMVNPVQFLAILERPLFAPDRKPPPPPGPPPPPDPMADVQITGIFSGENGGILARVEGKVRRVKINETIGAWSLKSISGRDVMFAQGAETRQMHLEYTRLGVTPVQSSGTPVSISRSGGVAPSAMAVTQSNQDEMRERLRRRNEIRAARGLPPVTD